MGLVLHYDFTQSSLANAALAGPTLTWSARGTDATYWDSSGVLQTADTDTPRLAAYWYDGAAWVNRGLLMEGARTNKARWSEDASKASWTRTGLDSISTNTTVAPDGNTTMDDLVEDSSTGRHQINEDVSLNASAAYTVSAFVTANGRGFAHLGATLRNGTEVEVYYNLTTGAKTGHNGSGQLQITGVQDLGGDTYRLWFVYSNTTGATQDNIHFGAMAEADTPSYEGDGSSGITLWGMTVENGNAPSSYIVVEGSDATRNKDILKTSDVSWYNYIEGTWFSETTKVDRMRPVESFIFRADDSANAANSFDGLLIRSDGTVWSDHHNATELDGDITGSEVTVLGSSARAAFAFADSDMQQYVNGVADGSDVAVGVEDDINELHIGADHSGTPDSFWGFIKIRAYYDERLANDDLADITANGIPSAAIPAATVGVGHPTPQRHYQSWQLAWQEIAIKAQMYQRGQSNNVGTFTLETGTTTTTVTDRRVGANTKVALSPTTANAAAAVAGTAYISAVTLGSFTVTHANSVQNDRTLDYALGG